MVGENYLAPLPDRGGRLTVEYALSDETLKKIAHELTANLRQNLTVDWSQRESVRAKLRLMVKRILRKYKYPRCFSVMFYVKLNSVR